MNISVIIENSVCLPNEKGLAAEHGLCVHITHEGKNTLFDVGRSDLFIHNAEKMGIDLSAVDYLVLSHAHSDHGGGLKHFFEKNRKAKVYMHRTASQKFYTKIAGLIPYYIGLETEVLDKNRNRINFIGEHTILTENIHLLVNFSRTFPLPKSNSSLYVKNGSRLVHDTFTHEIVLLLKENRKNIVFTACSHSGVINMVEKVQEYVKEETVDAVFGGFHTFNPVNRKNESASYLNLLAENLQKHSAVFYTGHCTGKRNFNFLKEKLGDKLQPMNTGTIIAI